MKYKGTVSIKGTGTEAKFEFEIDDEELDDSSEDYVYSTALEKLFELIDWEYREVGNQQNQNPELTLESKQCKWEIDNSDFNNYNTSCGEVFYLEEGSPKDNNISYCCFCGGKVI